MRDASTNLTKPTLRAISHLAAYIPRIIIDVTNHSCQLPQGWQRFADMMCDADLCRLWKGHWVCGAYRPCSALPCDDLRQHICRRVRLSKQEEQCTLDNAQRTKLGRQQCADVCRAATFVNQCTRPPCKTAKAKMHEHHSSCATSVCDHSMCSWPHKHSNPSHTHAAHRPGCVMIWLPVTPVQKCCIKYVAPCIDAGWQPWQPWPTAFQQQALVTASTCEHPQQTAQHAQAAMSLTPAHPWSQNARQVSGR
jgi:hypothetical protein